MRWRKLIRAMEVAGALMMIAGVAEAADGEVSGLEGRLGALVPAECRARS